MTDPYYVLVFIECKAMHFSDSQGFTWVAVAFFVGIPTNSYVVIVGESCVQFSVLINPSITLWKHATQSATSNGMRRNW